MKFLNQRIIRFGLLAFLAINFSAAQETSAQLKIGTVDVNRIFKDYSKARNAQAKINDAKNAAKKEFDERADTYKEAVAGINQINVQLEAPALSATAKAEKTKEREAKIAELKNMEDEIKEFRQTRETELQQEAQEMQQGIIQEIMDVVLALAQTKHLDLVLDQSGASISGLPTVLFARPSDDFTGDVLAALNKQAAQPTAGKTSKP